MRVLSSQGGILPHVQRFSMSKDGKVAERGHNAGGGSKSAQKHQMTTRCRHLCHPWLVRAREKE
jgi:hypothetical protein